MFTAYGDADAVPRSKTSSASRGGEERQCTYEKDVEQRRHADASRNSVEVKRRGLALGFDAVGIAPLEPNAHAAELDQWLSAGMRAP